MKKIFLTFIAFTSVLLLGSCETTATGTSSGSSLSSVKLVQNVLNNGTQNTYGIFGNSQNFIQNALIEAVLPQELKDINEKLISLGLSSVVDKEKQYISKIAAESITTIKPVLAETINNITVTDAVSILAGGKGAATNYLRQKTENSLVKALQPMVSTEVAKLGLDKLLNSAAGSGSGNALNTILGAVLGTTNATATESVDSLVTEHLVSSIFSVVSDTEKNSTKSVGGILGTVLGVPTQP